MPEGEAEEATPHTTSFDRGASVRSADTSADTLPPPRPHKPPIAQSSGVIHNSSAEAATVLCVATRRTAKRLERITHPLS